MAGVPFAAASSGPGAIVATLRFNPVPDEDMLPEARLRSGGGADFGRQYHLGYLGYFSHSLHSYLGPRAWASPIWFIAARSSLRASFTVKVPFPLSPRDSSLTPRGSSLL